MLLRQEGSPGAVLITQPAHAWISGQLARHWGNDRFATLPEPVCLAAEQHDIGFLEWDRNPSVNPTTGLPYSFLEMPAQTHLKLWEKGVRHMQRFGRYPALLVSLHFSNIARQQWISKAKKSLAKGYLDAQEELQQTLITSLQNDFYFAPLATDEKIREYQQSVSLLDWISLLLCLNAREETFVSKVLTRNGCEALRVFPLVGEVMTYAVDPWPFGKPEFELVCEGRRLLRPSRDDGELRKALRAAAPVTLRFKLRKPPA